MNYHHHHHHHQGAARGAAHQGAAQTSAPFSYAAAAMHKGQGFGAAQNAPWETAKSKKQKVAEKRANAPTPSKSSAQIAPPPLVMTVEATPESFDPREFRTGLNKALKSAGAKDDIRFSNISISLRQNVLLHPNLTAKTAEFVEFNDLIQQKAQEAGLVVEKIEIKEQWPKAVVHGVSLLDFPDNAAGLEFLAEEIQQFNKGLRLRTTPYYLGADELREYRAQGAVVIAVGSEDELKKILKSKIQLTGRWLRVSKYTSFRPTDRCSQCQAFGHLKMKCKHQPKCAICGRDHSTATHRCGDCSRFKCEHTIYRCVNCNGRHAAYDPDCPKFTEAKAKLVRPSASQMDNEMETEYYGLNHE